MESLKKQKSNLSLEKYAQLNEARDNAICAANMSAEYTLKEVADYFKLHLHHFSKIVTKRKDNLFFLCFLNYC